MTAFSYFADRGKESEAQLRRLAAAEDEAGCVNIGDLSEEVCANCGKSLGEHRFGDSDVVPASCWFPKSVADAIRGKDQ